MVRTLQYLHCVTVLVIIFQTYKHLSFLKLWSTFFLHYDWKINFNLSPHWLFQEYLLTIDKRSQFIVWFSSNETDNIDGLIFSLEIML